MYSSSKFIKLRLQTFGAHNMLITRSRRWSIPVFVAHTHCYRGDDRGSLQVEGSSPWQGGVRPQHPAAAVGHIALVPAGLPGRNTVQIHWLEATQQTVLPEWRHWRRSRTRGPWKICLLWKGLPTRLGVFSYFIHLHINNILIPATNSSVAEYAIFH